MTKKSKNDDKKNNDSIEKENVQRILELEKQISEQEEITKRAQSDYLRTKMEFDEYVKRSDMAKIWFELDWLMKALEKVLPFVNQLKTTLDNLPEDLVGNPWSAWVWLLYTKMLADIALLWVSPIKVALGSDPDYTLHIPIGMEDVEDESMKNKVVKEVEWWFVYEKWELKKVIMPAKVMVWT